MDPLSPVQLRILREAATAEGCREWKAASVKRLRRLDLVYAGNGGPTLFVTDKGREWLRKVDGK